jgi:hypothetical protein
LTKKISYGFWAGDALSDIFVGVVFNEYKKEKLLEKKNISSKVQGLSYNNIIIYK